jgi:hypothetical protein
MTFLRTLVYWETWFFLFVIFGTVAGLVLDGRIRLDGLLYGTKRDGTKYFSPERVQLLLSTLAFGFWLLSAVLRDPTKFPVISDGWLATLGGSHVLYVAGKFSAVFLGKK